MKRAKKLTDYQKARILAGYEKGTSIEQSGEVLGVNKTTITSYRSRFMKDFGLPPKEKQSKSKITARMGVLIKKIARETTNVGAHRIAQKLKQEIPDQPWYPSFKTIIRYLKKSGYCAKKHRLKPFINERNRLKRLKFAHFGV